MAKRNRDENDLKFICESWRRWIHSYGFACPEVLYTTDDEFDRYHRLIQTVPGAQAMLMSVTKYPGSLLFMGKAILPDRAKDGVSVA